MFVEVSDYLKLFEVFGINIIMVAMTAGFVTVVKKIFITAKIPVPSWVWLVVVMLAGFVISLFETTTAAQWAQSAIKNATAASYAYNVWEKIQRKLQGAPGD